MAHECVAEQAGGVGLWGGDGYLQCLVAGCEAQGVACGFGVGEGEGVCLAAKVGFHLGARLGGGVEEAAHAEVLGREGEAYAVGGGEGVDLYAAAFLVGGLEGDAVLDASDEVAAFGEEVDVEVLALGCCGALIAHAIVGIHLRIAVVAFFLGGFVYGQYAGEAAVRVEVEHGAGVGSHFVVAAGVAQYAALGVGFVDGGVHQGEGAVAAAVCHLQLLLAEHHACGGEQFDVEYLAVGYAAVGGVEHGGAEPDGLALEVGGVVEVEVYLLLRAEAVEVVDVGGLQENGLRLFLQGGLGEQGAAIEKG